MHVVIETELEELFVLAAEVSGYGGESCSEPGNGSLAGSIMRSATTLVRPEGLRRTATDSAYFCANGEYEVTTYLFTSYTSLHSHYFAQYTYLLQPFIVPILLRCFTNSLIGFIRSTITLCLWSNYLVHGVKKIIFK